MDNNNLSIYIHWPFCKKKCPYCDFNSHVNKTELDEDLWISAYHQSIDKFKHILQNKKIYSIFFGGGTPSLMPTRIVDELLKHIDQISSISNCEITLEANPTSFEKAKFKELKNIGINRLSIGIQSFNDKNLRFLGRQHSAKEAEETIIEAEKIFNNYSIDLIYSLPNQTAEIWKQELEYALKFAKHHISMYQLTIEKGTKFFSLFRDKKFTLPPEKVSHKLYTLTSSIAKQHGFTHYEISNFAKAHKESQHNLAYWKYQEYLGIGPGAHSRIKIGNKYNAFYMIHSPEKWLSTTTTGQSNIQENAVLSIEEIAHESLLMGLRLKEGINLKDFQYRFDANLLDFLDKDQIELLINKKLMTHFNDRIYLKEKGRILINHILKQLIK
ncbi:MAG: coproporphyrinogen III oxidase [Rickettsiales bacterium]|nr:coproporphyrinogen III oxidase [Rickettsiales bacterium]